MQKITADTPPDRMDRRDAARLHSYAALCRHLHPGALGEFVAREFEHWAGCGYAADPTGLLWRVAADLDEQVHAQLRAERDRWAAETPHKPHSRLPRPSALRAAQDAITGRVQP